MSARIDHLVVAAAGLDEGAAWCVATLGVVPGPVGEHPLMGTHNRVLRIATVDHPRAYLEIIAVQPGRAAQRPRRWFDLDAEAVRDTLAHSGPRLLHFVANVPDLRQALAALRGLQIDRGEAVAASRMTPRGLLEWQMSIREDGQRLFDGTLPTLIQWGATHPASAMPESGVTLKEGAARLCAVLDTPRGRVKLDSAGL